MPNEYCGQYGNLGEVKKAIARIKESHPHVEILLSFGGAANTWNPGDASADAVSKSILKFVEENGFDGVDMDLEIPVKAEYMEEVVTAIRKGNPNLLITCAPQAVYDNGLGACLVTTGWNQDYNDAINAQCFDYIWPQFYNNVKWSAIDGLDEHSAEYIPTWLKKFEEKQDMGLFPENITFIPGLPATKEAGDGCVGHDTNENIRKMLTSYKGTMCWSTNQDKINNWTMVTQIMP